MKHLTSTIIVTAAFLLGGLAGCSASSEHTGATAEALARCGPWGGEVDCPGDEGLKGAPLRCVCTPDPLPTPLTTLCPDAAAISRPPGMPLCLPGIHIQDRSEGADIWLCPLSERIPSGSDIQVGVPWPTNSRDACLGTADSRGQYVFRLNSEGATPPNGCGGACD